MPRRRLEQLGGLAADDLEIAAFADVGIVAVHQLQDLAFGDRVGGVGQHLHHPHVVRADHHLERARVKEVAHQDRRGVAESRVGRVAAAPQLRLVDDVVVQQRRGVDKLDHRGELEVGLAAISGGAGAQQQQRRAQPLAAPGDDVFRDLPHQGDVRVQTLAHQVVDPLHFVGDGGEFDQGGHGGAPAQGRVLALTAAGREA